MSPGLSSSLGQSGQFPPVFGSIGRGGRSTGVFITILLVIILIWMFDLSGIASIGSAVGLVVFSLVSIAHPRVIDETGAKGWLIFLGLVVTVAVLVAFSTTTLVNEPRTLAASILLIVVSIVLDFIWKTVRNRRESPASSID